MLKTKESELVSARLSPKEIEEIEKLVEEGFYMNTADFVRMAVREKLESIRTIELRDNVSVSHAKKEILGYLSTKGNAYASEISKDLKLDLDIVFSVLNELKKQGRVE